LLKIGILQNWAAKLPPTKTKNEEFITSGFLLEQQWIALTAVFILLYSSLKSTGVSLWSTSSNKMCTAEITTTCSPSLLNLVAGKDLVFLAVDHNKFVDKLNMLHYFNHSLHHAYYDMRSKICS